MTEREEEKTLIDRFVAQRETDLVRSFIRMLELRFERHKNSLVANEDGTVRGRAQECRELIKNLKGNGAG